jgi:phosphatidate cytidylyltransferase
MRLVIVDSGKYHQKMTSLQLRILSAFVSVSILVALTYFFHLNGVRFGVVFFTFAAIREAGRIFFPHSHEKNEKYILMLSAAILFSLSVILNMNLAAIFSIVTAFSVSILILKYRSLENVNISFNSIVRMFFGIFYVGLLPVFPFLILNLRKNIIWFIVLLSVVFASDTFAYACGRLWGKAKIAPALSPKKTTIGSIGGLLGALFAGLLSVYFLPEIPWHVLILMSLVAGFIGQMGDLFESLVKRVAGVKDSGTMMPGHGGILDRIDGVLFAAPVVYFVAALFQ